MSNNKTEYAGFVEFIVLTISCSIFFILLTPRSALLVSFCVLMFLLIIAYSVSLWESASERIELRKEKRQQDRNLYVVPLELGLKSENPQLQAATSKAVRDYGMTKAALEEVYQTYTFDQLVAGAQPKADDSSPTLEPD